MVVSDQTAWPLCARGLPLAHSRAATGATRAPIVYIDTVKWFECGWLHQSGWTTRVTSRYSARWRTIHCERKREGMAAASGVGTLPFLVSDIAHPLDAGSLATVCYSSGTVLQADTTFCYVHPCSSARPLCYLALLSSSSTGGSQRLKCALPVSGAWVCQSFHTTLAAIGSKMSASDDMRVVVDQMPADPVKPPPSKLPSWLQSKRNKALAGLSLLTLIAIPAIVAPVVVSQQKQQQHNTVSPRDQQLADEQMARNAATQNEDPDAFIDVEAPRVRNTTRFNATRYNSTRATRRNTTSTLKVPARSWALANKTRASLTKPETWTPFVKIRDGQVRAQNVPGRLVVGGGTRSYDIVQCLLLLSLCGSPTRGFHPACCVWDACRKMAVCSSHC